MSKKQGSYIGALKVTVAKLTADKLALTTALGELGYCHEQQTKFITDSMSGADGAISREILFNENKAALAEAVATNTQLTDDLEFQAHRYSLQKQALGHANKTCAGYERELIRLSKHSTSLRTRLNWAKGVGLFACILAIGQALQNAGLITPFIG